MLRLSGLAHDNCTLNQKATQCTLGVICIEETFRGTVIYQYQTKSGTFLGTLDNLSFVKHRYLTCYVT